MTDAPKPTPATDSVTRSVELPVPPERAFQGFVEGFNDWWPREHCFCGEPALDRVFIDLDAGLWAEVTREGATIPWGAVIEHVPGKRLVLGWQMDATVSPWIVEPDPARASVVEVTFTATETGCRVELIHRDFANHGEGAKAMSDVMIGLDRWAEWLADFAAALSRPAAA